MKLSEYKHFSCFKFGGEGEEKKKRWRAQVEGKEKKTSMTPNKNYKANMTRTEIYTKVRKGIEQKFISFQVEIIKRSQ